MGVVGFSGGPFVVWLWLRRAMPWAKCTSSSASSFDMPPNSLTISQKHSDFNDPRGILPLHVPAASTRPGAGHGASLQHAGQADFYFSCAIRVQRMRDRDFFVGELDT